MKDDGDGIEQVSCARKEMVRLVPTQVHREGRHKGLRTNDDQGSAGFRMPEMADERGTEECRQDYKVIQETNLTKNDLKERKEIRKNQNN